ncbi:vacuolar protein sorting-associated protein 72 [[Candida] jaroonii]|uniref:Vacuolar protein sorting-associated protein 72 n=1 Tax=[Candida] jaroonii TaxID=467808 RepID=A0ACA9Y165_9ASCO|nr:vacuolar protein sorting-associated protein 72 [[Candida] jaroonii]
MSDDEFLTTTRERRANAGSRLRQLLDLENDTKPSVSKFISEDDENVNLLFQEDEDDGEFEESESEEEEDEDDQEDNENNDVEVENGDEEQAGDEEEEEEGNAADELLSDAPIDSDHDLSDSDISLSDDDEYEGERELEKQEKQKKRKKLNKLVPQIKKFKNDAKPKPKKRVTSESLLSSVRKSSRSSAIENKEALVEKLRRDEKRRENTAPIIRIKQRELTQEEKLAEAVETEKQNIISLELFRQQEVVKKERQKHLLQSRRKKLVDIVRFLSIQEYITPNQEIELARNLYWSLTTKSKRRNLKKIQRDYDIDLSRVPGEIDKSLPYYIEEQKQKELEEAEIAVSVDITEGSENGNGSVEVNGSEGAENENGLVEVNGSEVVGNGKEAEEVKDVEMRDVEMNDVEMKDMGVNNEANGHENKDVEIQNGHIENVENGHIEESRNGTNEQVSSDGIVENGQDKSLVTEESQISEVKTTESEPIPEPKETDEETRKTVTFAEGVKEPNEPIKEMSEEPSEEVTDTQDNEDEEEEEIFEGPAQKICRNYINLIEFTADKPLNDINMKRFVFGEDAALTGSRRFKDLKTILRIGNAGNPYAKIKETKDELFTPVTDLTEDNAMFEELNRLPQLGIRQEIVEETTETNDNDSNIRINTEAPLGLYLPNGNKKICLITGTEVKYFDPSIGVPYSDVDTFKFLTSIENGNIPWYNFDGEYNDTGATELYLGSRDGVLRHARGVPEGFD